MNAANSINGGDSNILNSLNQVKQAVQNISRYRKDYNQFFRRINLQCTLNLKELSGELEDAETKVNIDSSKLEEVNAMLDKMNRLLN